MTDIILPSDLVASLLSLQNGSWAPVFSAPANIYFANFFSPAFIAAWIAAAAYNNTFPVCDGDPITGYFSVASLKLNNTSTDLTSETTCTVSASITASLPEATIASLVKTCNVAFMLVLINGRWLIDDIDQGISSRDKNGVLAKHPTLRSYFTQVPAIAASCSTPISSITVAIDAAAASTDGLVERT